MSPGEHNKQGASGARRASLGKMQISPTTKQQEEGRFRGMEAPEILVRKSFDNLSGQGRSERTRRREERQQQQQQPQQQQRTCLLMLSSLLTCLQLMILSFLLVPSASGFYIDEKQSPKRHEWSYDQSSWPKLYSSCSLKAQSPIDIQAKNVIQSNHLRLFFYNYNRPTKFKLQNAHHTVKMNPLGFAYQTDEHPGAAAAAARHGPGANSSLSLDDMITADEYVELAPGSSSSAGSPGSSGQRDQHAKLLANNRSNNNHLSGGSKSGGGPVAAVPAAPDGHLSAAISPNDIVSAEDVEQSRLPYEGAPTIRLDWLDEGNSEFKLRDVHFHWGERRDNGSEHAIDGRRAAMEMHLVHIKHGLDKSKIGFTSDSVAVIAILIESHRKSNADFNPIVNVLSRINMTDEPEEIEYKSIYDLLPSNLNSFYTYSGSLTTPPCYQVVNWIVMTERLNMNAKQIEMFRNLYAPSQESIGQHDDDHGEPATTGAATTTTTTTEQSSDHQDGRHGSLLMVPNIRQLQALNNRTILASFSRWPMAGSALGAAAHQSRPYALISIGLAPLTALLLLLLLL